MTRSSDSDLPPGVDRIRQYRLEERLGAGGMGAVFRAFDEILQRPVAVKRLLPTMADEAQVLRFRREARMAARLNHPAIVHIYEIVESGDGDWIVMELVRGKTLDRLLREERLDLARAIRVAREIAEGLSEAHAHGIVHRDLKATNVMVTGAGRVKILDFGLAKVYRGDGDHDISRPGTVVGTCHAMSPEQAQGLPVDHRSDLFSLGSLLYELITGISPFHAATPTETLARICAYEPVAVSEVEPSVPSDLADLTHRLLAKSAARRPQSSWEVATALERLERVGADQAQRREAAAMQATQVETMRLEPLAEPATPARSSSRLPLTSTERRQMTVLCCEVADTSRPGSDAAQAFDPETLYELMLQLRPLAQAAARRYEGSLGNALGHRLLLYFGYPETHEDDAWRAVRTGLDLVEEAGRHLSAGSGPGRVSPALRVAIHTGTAVVSTNPHAPDPVVLGGTLDVAVRLLASAAPGTVVISGATRSLVHRGVTTEALPSVPGSGVGEPLVPYVVRDGSVSGEETTFDLAPLVGRERELDLVLTRWAQARAGSGQAVLLSGEPGIGKSRLLRAVREGVQASGGAARWLSTHGSPYTQNTPLHPVILLVQRLSAGEPGASPLEQLESLLHRYALDEALPLFASLLDVPLPPQRRMAPMPPERQREDTLDALVALVLELSEQEPVVLVVEDLHWLDATTLAWLDRLIDQAQTAPLLLLMTLRPNTLDVPWASRSQVTQITLGALSAEDTGHLIQLLAGDVDLRPTVRQQIVARTDGVPLFVEELTRAVLEGGDSAEWRELPTTLRESLSARLGRLGTAKEVAQLASVIGRTFTLSLLAAVSSHGVDALERELRRLVQSGLVHRRGFGAHTRYAFKHALVRDAAYDSLLRRERQHVHLRIALALEEQKRAAAEDVLPEVVAHHYMAGEQFQRAYECWFEAGRLAMARSAHAEAIAHLQHALEALQSEPPSADRDRREIALRSALAMSLGIIRGLSSADVEATQDRLLALLGRVEDVPHEIFFGLWNFYMSRAKLRQARDLAQQRLAYGLSHDDTDARLLGGYTGAATDFFRGNLTQAADGFERVLATYPAGGLQTQAIAYDIGVVSLSLLADVRWVQGWPDTALRLTHDAIERGARSSPFTHSVALVDAMALLMSMRDVEGAVARARQLERLSEEHAFQYWTVFWQIVYPLGRLSSDLPAADVDAALEASVGAVTLMRTGYGSNLQCTRYLGWIIDACLRHGRLVLARTLLEQALPLTQEERYHEAELRRLQAALLLGEADDDVQVEACLQQALTVARAQGARLFELRAAVDLAAFLRTRGRSEEGRAVLAPIYAAFEEGGASIDLLAAREMLALMPAPPV